MTRVLLFVLALCILFSGCIVQQPSKAEYNISAPQSLSIPENYDPSQKTPSLLCSYERILYTTASADYSLPSALAAEEADGIISQMETVLQKLAPENLKIHFYIHEDLFFSVNKEGSAIYLPLDIRDLYPMATVGILYLMTDVHTHFGLLYGSAVLLCEETLGIEASMPTNDQLLTDTLTKNKDILDLTLPVFSSRYYPEDAVSLHKGLATDLVRYLSQNDADLARLRELIRLSAEWDASFPVRYVEAVNTWLSSRRLHDMYTVDADAVMIQYSTYQASNFPICTETMYTQYYIHRSFVDESLSDFLHPAKSYADLKHVIQTTETETNAVGEFLNIPRPTGDERTLCFVFNGGDLSLAYSEERRIHALDISTLLHEHIHVLTLTAKDLIDRPTVWLSEGLAEYCSAEFSTFANGNRLYANAEQFKDWTPMRVSKIVQALSSWNQAVSYYGGNVDFTEVPDAVQKYDWGYLVTTYLIEERGGVAYFMETYNNDTLFEERYGSDIYTILEEAAAYYFEEIKSGANL